MKVQSDVHFIYALIDPRNGKARYIGRSIYPKRRLRQHITDARLHHKVNRPSYVWVRSLLKSGLEPGIIVLERTHGKIVSDREEYWYKLGMSLGCDLLNNAAAIGVGGRSEYYLTFNRAK